MTQIVEVPGYGQVEFPDDMSDVDIGKAIQRNFMMPKPQAEMKPPHKADIASNAIIKGFAGLLDLPAKTFLVDLPNLGIAAYGTGKRLLTGSDDLPDPIDPEKLSGFKKLGKATGAIRPEAEPVDSLGRMIDFTGQVVGGAGLGSSQGAKQALAGGLLGGASGEAVDKLLPNSPVLKTGAQMLGVLGGSLPFTVRGTPAENINAAAKNLTPEQWKQAQQLMDDAARMGSPITGAEAIAQVASKNSLQDIQRVVEQSKKGAPIVQPMMNQRTQANEAMFQRQADQIAPMPTNPAATPVNLQQASSGALTQARQAGNKAAEPFYEAASKEIIPSETWNNLTANPAVAQAIQRVKSQPQWGVSKEPNGSIRLLDAAKRWIDDQLQTATPNEARIWGEANNSIKSAADSVSQNYAQARNIVAQNRQNVVTPMQNSPVGNLAETAGLSAEDAMKVQSNILMPTAPRALNPDVIKKTAATLKMQNPQALRDFTRQNLQAIFDETTQKLASGENQFGGAKFASTIAGNPRQAENLKTLIESTAGSGAYKGFNRMLEVLEAQGKRQAAGSQTEFNKQISQNLSAGGLMGEMVTTGMSPVKWGTFVSDWWNGVKYGNNTEQMAKLLTDPKSVQKMRQLSMLNPFSSKARLLVQELITLQANEGE